jgi:hypothetical protein
MGRHFSGRLEISVSPQRRVIDLRKPHLLARSANEFCSYAVFTAAAWVGGREVERVAVHLKEKLERGRAMPSGRSGTAMAADFITALAGGDTAHAASLMADAVQYREGGYAPVLRVKPAVVIALIGVAGYGTPIADSVTVSGTHDFAQGAVDVRNGHGDVTRLMFTLMIKDGWIAQVSFAHHHLPPAKP